MISGVKSCWATFIIFQPVLLQDALPPHGRADVPKASPVHVGPAEVAHRVHLEVPEVAVSERSRRGAGRVDGLVAVGEAVL